MLAIYFLGALRLAIRRDWSRDGLPIFLELNMAVPAAIRGDLPRDRIAIFFGRP